MGIEVILHHADLKQAGGIGGLYDFVGSEKCISLSDSLFLFRGTENFKTTRENSCYLLAKCSDSDLKSGQLVFARDDTQQVRLFEVLQPEFAERTIFVSVDDGEFTTFQLSEQTKLIGVLLDELDFI